MSLTPGFLMSVDTECLTALPRRLSMVERTADLARFLDEIRRLAPCLPGPSGLFTGYGRIYIDASHVELAAAECASPFEVPVMLEKLQSLAARAAAGLLDRGIEIILATCTHGGRLQVGTPSWGAHENYLLGTEPELLVDRILPFLVTRIHSGAGAVWFPTGDFLAGARLTCLSADTGGGTTDRRALFSTARQEHHSGGLPGHFRCHLILGDGHRSGYSLALQLGTTALVLRAVEANPQKIAPFPRRAGLDQSRFWLASAQMFNRLARPGQSLRAHPFALDVQEFYRDLSSEFVSKLAEPPQWTYRILRDWSETLAKLREGDDGWLGLRLDPWIKHRVFSAWLRAKGFDWTDLPGRDDLLDGLALLDVDYHTFSAERNLFDQLEKAGLIQQTDSPSITPGDEPTPFEPEVATRAKARGRFLLESEMMPNLVMDWSKVEDLSERKSRKLDDPFAQEYSPWEPLEPA